MVDEEQEQEADNEKTLEKQDKMDPFKKTAKIVGVLFITATVAYSIGMIILDPILGDPDYLSEVSQDENLVIIGAFFVLIDAVAVAGIGIWIYPVLKKHNEASALGYAGARIAEGILFTVNAMFILTLLSLSQEYVKAGAPSDPYYQTLGTVLMAAGDWAFLLGFGLAFTISALIVNFVLYQSKLVPRWLSSWGLVGAVLLWVYYLLQYLGVSYIEILFLPIAVQEMVFAIWLIVKGFDTTSVDSKEG